jgi:exo-1,4-beta-D-glucosaminidase
MGKGNRPMRKILAMMIAGITIATAHSYCAEKNEKDKSVSRDLLLTAGWEIQSCDKVKENGDIVSTDKFKPDGWYAAPVPSTVLAVLCKNGVFPDPYFGENLRKIPGYQDGIWYSMPDNSPFRIPYWYRTEFRLPQEYIGRKIWLHFDGINYKANIWLNGKRIADSNSVVSMFIRYAFDVTDKVTIGNNYLAVQITAPGQSHGKNDKESDMECTSSWDDHCPYPPDGNMGIWRSVYIRATGSVIIKHPNVVCKLDLPSADVAHLRISGQINNTADKQVTGILRAIITDVDNIAVGGNSKGRGKTIVVCQTVTLKPQETKEAEFLPDKFGALNIKNPRLWWPNPLGQQNLYKLQLEFEIDGEISDSISIDFGIRQITTHLNKAGWRVIQLNGKNILGRGGTWMTSDLLLQFSSKRYESMLRYAKEMNWNLMRVEGYSIKELPEFYDMCDKYGIMTAPEIFARNTADHKLQLECFKDHLLEIRHHPSIIHFIGHDETVPSRDIDKGYRKLIDKYAPHITYQAGSGGTAEERSGMGGTRTGGPWHFSTPSYYYGQDSNTEWTIFRRNYASGATYSGGIGGEVALAENFHKFLPESDVWPTSRPAWRFHTICTGTWLDGDQEGKLVPSFTKLLNRRYGQAKNIDEFSYKAQIMTMEAMRALHEVVAQNKYECTFLLTWKFNAPWPTTLSWNVVDWYLAPTGAYYGTKKACEPLHVQYSYDNDTIYVINSHYQNFEKLKVTANLYDLNMTKKYSKSLTVNIGPDSSNKIFTVERPKDIKQTYFLKLELKDRSDNLISSNFYWLSTQPDEKAEFSDLYNLAEVDLDISCSVEKKGDTCFVYADMQNPSSTLAFAVNPKIKKSVSGDLVLPIYWEDNYFSLLPGEKRRVKVEFDIKDIGTEEPSLVVSGWNIKSEETKILINP